MVLWDSIVGSLLNKVAPAVAGYYQRKLELKYTLREKKLEGKIALEQRKIDLAAQSEQRDHEWEQLMIHNSGWKDEWVLILLSIPLVLVFIPQTQGAVLEGFKVLGMTPQWYQWMVVVIFLAIYGIRAWRRESGHANI
jgi:hypothetical protein